MKKSNVLAVPLDEPIRGRFYLDVRVTCSSCRHGTRFIRLTDFQWEHLNRNFLESYLCERCCDPLGLIAGKSPDQ